MSTNSVPLRAKLLDAQTADETTSNHVDLAGYSNVAITIIGAGTISGGVLTIEEADFQDAAAYGGTWSLVTTYTCSGVSGGAQAVIHFPPALYPNLRVRISTAISGANGTITVILRAN